MKVTIRIENSIVAFVRYFDPISPSFSLCLLLIFFVGRVLVNEILNVFVDHGGHPTRGGCIEFNTLFLLGFECPNFYFFTRNWAVDLIGRRLCDRLGGECFFGRCNDGERVVKIVLRSIVIHVWPCFHLLIYY